MYNRTDRIDTSEKDYISYSSNLECYMGIGNLCPRKLTLRHYLASTAGSLLLLLMQLMMCLWLSLSSLCSARHPTQ